MGGWSEHVQVGLTRALGVLALGAVLLILRRLAGWPSRNGRWRWGAMGLALVSFCAGFVLFEIADAHAVKLR